MSLSEHGRIWSTCTTTSCTLATSVIRIKDLVRRLTRIEKRDTDFFVRTGMSMPIILRIAVDV